MQLVPAASLALYHTSCWAPSSHHYYPLVNLLQSPSPYQCKTTRHYSPFHHQSRKHTPLCVSPLHHYGPLPRCHSNRLGFNAPGVHGQDSSHDWGETIVVSGWGSQDDNNGLTWSIFQHVIMMNKWSLRGSGVTSGSIRRLWDTYSSSTLLYIFYFLAEGPEATHAFFPLVMPRFF